LQLVLNWAVNKYKKQYFISLLIAIVIGFSTVFMGISGAVRTFDKYSKVVFLFFLFLGVAVLITRITRTTLSFSFFPLALFCFLSNRARARVQGAVWAGAL
jgi:hypothetical protein